MYRSLQYHNQGRGGSVVYQDDISTIRFDFEFGAGNCVAIIFIPTPENWLSSTNRPPEERADIIAFVARQALHDQLSNGYYEIYDNYIELYRN